VVEANTATVSGHLYSSLRRAIYAAVGKHKPCMESAQARCNRRGAMQALLMASLAPLLWASGSKPAAAEELEWFLPMDEMEELIEEFVTPPLSGKELRVGSIGDTYRSINAALTAAEDGDHIVVEAGTYKERLLISKAVSIEAAPGAQPVVEWRTGKPYECTVGSVGPTGAVLRGLTIRHASKSVANNYAVFLQTSNLELRECDITSSTGAGIGIEGGIPIVRQCVIHNCERQGIACFSELGSEGGGGNIVKTQLVGNKGDGILVRDGADPIVLACSMTGNGGHGATLRSCHGDYANNIIVGNKQGSVLMDADVEIDLEEFCTLNRLDPLPDVEEVYDLLTI